MQCGPERGGELAVAYRFRRRAVDRPAPAFVLECREDHGDQIVAVDPGYVLPPARHRAAEAEPEGREHRAQCAAVRV